MRFWGSSESGKGGRAAGCPNTQLPPQPHPHPHTHTQVELLAFWWFSFLMGITAIVLSVIILLTTSRRIKHARKFVLYGEHLPAHIAAQAAIGFLTENVFWGLPYWLRCVAFTYAAVTMTFAQRPRWCQLIDVACIAYRGVWVMLLYCPKDFVLVGACVRYNLMDH